MDNRLDNTVTNASVEMEFQNKKIKSTSLINSRFLANKQKYIASIKGNQKLSNTIDLGRFTDKNGQLRLDLPDSSVHQSLYNKDNY